MFFLTPYTKIISLFERPKQIKSLFHFLGIGQVRGLVFCLSPNLWLGSGWELEILCGTHAALMSNQYAS
jgi:hypothetical protein